jgi:hypothetical protein
MRKKRGLGGVLGLCGGVLEPSGPKGQPSSFQDAKATFVAGKARTWEVRP